MIIHRLLIYFFISYFLFGCAGTSENILPLTAIDSAYLATEREQKLIKISENAHSELVSKGLIYRQSDANHYLSVVGNTLIPKNINKRVNINFNILKDSSINAFAMPNGNIYITVGLLAKLENEAQLAHVLAHEIAHVIQRHSYQSQLNRRNTVITAHIADMFLLGTGVAYIPAGLELAMHSRDSEKEADILAVDYLLTKNYDVNESSEVFSKLVEVKDVKKSGSVWESHPDSTLRTAYTKKLIAEKDIDFHGNIVREKEYDALRQIIAELNIKLRINSFQLELAEDAINYEIAKQGDAAKWDYYLGEVFRKRGEQPEMVAQENAWLYGKDNNDQLKNEFKGKVDEYFLQSIEYYQRVLSIDPDDLLVKRGLGLVYYSLEDFEKAKVYFNEYLSEGNAPKDRYFINSMIDKIDKGRDDEN